MITPDHLAAQAVPQHLLDYIASNEYVRDFGDAAIAEHRERSASSVVEIRSTPGHQSKPRSSSSSSGSTGDDDGGSGDDGPAPDFSDLAPPSSPPSSNIFLNFPAELRARTQWVGWRAVQRDGRTSKPPYKVDPKPRAGVPYQLASPTRRHDWSTFEHALAATVAGKVEGPGFVFSDDDPYSAFDLDGCRDAATGEIVAEALEIIAKFPGYWEISPSGTGVHGIVRGAKPDYLTTESKRTNPWPKICEKDPAIEVYSSGRYFTVTGQKLEGCESEVADCQEALTAWCESLWPRPAADAATMSTEGNIAERFPGSDDELLEVMFRAKNGARVQALWNGDTSAYDNDASNADAALVAHLVFYCGKDQERVERLFGRSKLGEREKWTSRADYRNRTISKAISQCGQFYKPPSKKEEVESIGPDDVKPFDTYEIPPITYIVDRWLAEGTGEIWCGASGVGKSMVATALGDAVAHGQEVFGLNTSKRPVLLIDGGENPAPVMQHRLKVLQIKPSEEFKIWGEWVGSLAQIPSVKISEWVDRCDPKPLIIIDCLAVFFSGKSENDAAEMRAFFKRLQDWKARGATYIMLHNRGKNEALAFRGTSVIKDAGDVMRVLDSETDDFGKIRLITFEQEKNRIIREDSLPKSFALKFDETTGVFTRTATPMAVDGDKKLMEILIENPGSSHSELENLASEFKISRRKVDKFLADGLKVGYIKQKAEGKEKKHWYEQSGDHF